MVQLSVGVSTSTENPKVNTNVNTETAIQDYNADALSAEIGNHVQLRTYSFFFGAESSDLLIFFILVLEAADDTYSVMDDYALSLNQCWASKTDLVTDHTYDSAEGHILLWDEFCPEFPWVGPLAYSSGSLPTHVSS